MRFRENLIGTSCLMGRYYLNIGLTYRISALMPFTGMIIYNLPDYSFSLSPTLEYNIAEDIYISAGAYSALGKRPGIFLLADGLSVTCFHSEFGANPHMFFAAFRIYF